MTNDDESRAENKRSGPPSPARNCTPLQQPKTKKHNGMSSTSFGLGTSSPQQYGAFSLKVEPSRNTAAHQGSSEGFSMAATGLQSSNADKASTLGHNKSANFCPRVRSSSEGGNVLNGGQASSLNAIERTPTSSQESVPALSKRPESVPHNPARGDRVAAKDLPGDTKAAVHTGGRWSMDEDDILRKTVMELGAKNWKNISAVAFNGRRTDVQCLHRWQKVLRPGLVKGAWTKQEDEVVIEMVRKHGVGGIKWSVIASELPGRLGKQCRERWFNHLDPNLKRDPWSVEEDKVLMEAQQRLGNKWCQIAALLPGRSENAVKNRWNSAMRRKVQDMKKSKLQACQQQHLQQRLQQQQQPRQGEQLQQLTQHEGSGSCLQQQQQTHGAPMHHLSQPPRQHTQHAHLYQHQQTLLQHTQQPRHQQQRRQMQKDEHLVQTQPHAENQLNDLHCMEHQHLHRGQGMVSSIGMANNNRPGSAERKSHKCDKSFATTNQIPDPNKMFFSAPKPNVEISPITGKPKRKYTRRKQKVQTKPLVNNRFDYMSAGPHATPNGTGKKGRKAQSRMLPFAPEEDFGDHGHGADHRTFQHNAGYGTGSAFDAFWPDLGPTSGPFVPNTMNITNNVMNNSTANSSNSTITNNNNGSNGSNNLANVFEMGNGFSFGPPGGFSDGANRCEAPESSGLLNGGLSLDGTTNHDDSHGQALLEDLGFFNMQMDMSDPTACDNVLSGMGFDSSQNHVLDQICDDFFPTM